MHIGQMKADAWGTRGVHGDRISVSSPLVPLPSLYIHFHPLSVHFVIHLHDSCSSRFHPAVFPQHLSHPALPTPMQTNMRHREDKTALLRIERRGIKNIFGTDVLPR